MQKIEMDRIHRSIQDRTEEYAVDGDHLIPLVFDVFPGGGKTTNVLKTLDDLGKKFIYLPPTHGVTKENLTCSMHHDYVGAFEHFMAKKWVCLNEEYRTMAQDKGMPIDPLCFACDKKDSSCPYFDVKRTIEYDDPPSWAGVHGHITTYLRDYLDKRPRKFDVLVIEENPMDTLMEEERMGPLEIKKLHDKMELFQEWNLKKQDGKYSMHVLLISDLMDILGACFTLKTLRYMKLGELAGEWNKLDWKFFVEGWNTFTVLRMMPPQNDFDIPRAPFELFTRIFAKQNEETLPYHVKLVKNDWDTWPYIMVSFFHSSVLHGLPLKVIALDGTADEEVWNKILGRKCDFYRAEYKYENVWQFSKPGNPISSCVRNGKLSKQGDSILKMAAMVVKKHDSRTLLVGSKRFKPHVEKEMSGMDYSYAVYYNLRSMNKYMDCDNVILLFRPSPPVETVAIRTVLSGWGEETWKRYLTTGEMLQAIARIRQNICTAPSKSLGDVGGDRKRGEMNIYVFSDEPIFNVERDIQPGHYHYLTKAAFEYYLRTGREVSGAGRNDAKTRDEILDILSCRQLTLKEMLVSTTYKATTRRVLRRMCANGEVKLEGGKYGV